MKIDLVLMWHAAVAHIDAANAPDAQAAALAVERKQANRQWIFRIKVNDEPANSA